MNDVTTVKVGDRLVWFRAGNEDHVSVIGVRPMPNGRTRIHVKVDGWASDGGWQDLDYHFITEEEYKKRKAAEKFGR